MLPSRAALAAQAPVAALADALTPFLAPGACWDCA